MSIHQIIACLLLYKSNNYLIITIFQLYGIIGAYASMLTQKKKRTFPSISGKSQNIPKCLANQI